MLLPICQLFIPNPSIIIKINEITTTLPVGPRMTRPFPRGWVWVGIVLALIALLALLIVAPPPLLRKLDYIGAAVCHRLPSHSFFINEHQLPICQRCTGTFSGALTGIIVQWVVLRRRREQGFPALKYLLLFGLFAAMWGGDGFNSFLGMRFNNDNGLLYMPQPGIRLLTGILMGLGMSAILVPAFNLTLWADGTPAPVLRSWRDLATLLLSGLAVGALIFTLSPWLLYPAALYSTLGVLAMFTCLGAMMFVMAIGRENTCTGWRTAWVPLVWGFVFAALIVAVMDTLRWLATGTLDGFPLL